MDKGNKRCITCLSRRDESCKLKEPSSVCMYVEVEEQTCDNCIYGHMYRPVRYSACQEYREALSGKNEPRCQSGGYQWKAVPVKEVIDTELEPKVIKMLEEQETEAENDLDKSYMKDSLVATRKERLKDMIAGHWNYVKGVILSSCNYEPAVMKVREHDYTTAFAHGYGHGLEDAGSLFEVSTGPSFTSFITRHKDWASKTFGTGDRSTGIIEHIRKELDEVAEDPTDVEEWMDIVILAIHGAWRTGATSEEISDMLSMKMAKNERRVWPNREDQNPDIPVEHTKPVKKITQLCDTCKGIHSYCNYDTPQKDCLDYQEGMPETHESKQHLYDNDIKPEE